jgi:hypothetical protein
VTRPRPGGAREPARLLWHTDPSCGDPDDDLAAAVLKELAAEGVISLAAAVVNRRPAPARARQFGATLAALGLTADGRPLPVGTGDGTIGRPMPPVHPGAPQAHAPGPLDGRRLQETTLRQAPDASLCLLATTALTDLDWLLDEHEDLARRKLRAITIMADARPAAGPAAAWEPGNATNCTVDPGSAARVYARLQRPAWRHVPVSVVSRWAVLAAGEVTPALLDDLARASPVAAWLRDRAAASMNERWGSFCRGTVPGRSRQVFVDCHLGGRDPGRGAGEPVFDLITGVPVYDAVAAVAAVEPHWFMPAADPRAPNFTVIGTSPADTGVRNPGELRERLAVLLRRGFGATTAA